MGIGIRFSGVNLLKDRSERFSDLALRPYRAAFGKTISFESNGITKRPKHPIIARIAFIALLPFTLLATGVGKAALSCSKSYKLKKKNFADLEKEVGESVIGQKSKRGSQRLKSVESKTNSLATSSFSGQNPNDVCCDADFEEVPL